MALRRLADKDAKRMGGIQAFLDPKGLGSTFGKMQSESMKLAMGGDAVKRGQSAMKVAMMLKDLTGAQSVAQLGG